MRKLTSRKFWIAFLSAIFIVLTEGLGWNVPQETYWAVVALATAYIFGESYVDSRK